jgi:hypothetical protein
MVDDLGMQFHSPGGQNNASRDLVSPFRLPLILPSLDQQKTIIVIVAVVVGGVVDFDIRRSRPLLQV